LTSGVWYVSAVVSSGVGVARANGFNDAPTSLSVGANVDVAITTTGGEGLMISSNGSYVGSISSICVSDTQGVCVPVPPPTPTPMATSTLVDNPAQNAFNGMVLFMMAFWGIIWFFRKAR